MHNPPPWEVDGSLHGEHKNRGQIIMLSNSADTKDEAIFCKHLLDEMQCPVKFNIKTSIFNI